MKKIAFLFSVVFLISACSSSKDMSSSKADNRKLKKLAEQADIKRAVESRKYVIKVDRLYVRGSRIDLIPTSNFVIVNGEIASISLAYMGNSFGRPISGINMNGRANSYKMESNETKGGYKIQMSVIYGSDKFDVYLTIGSSGNCNISLNNAYIQSVNYSGNLVPLSVTDNVPVKKGDRI